MRTSSLAAVLITGVLSLLVVGCGGEDIDTIPKSLVTLLDDTTAVLKEITDEQTALAAQPKLRLLAERKLKIDEQAKSTKVSKEGMAKSDEKYLKPIQEAGEKMNAEIVRIATTSPQAAEIVATSMGMR